MRIYKHIEAEYNRPNPWYYFQSSDDKRFDTNSRQPFLLAFWFQGDFSELYETIPVAFPCLGQSNNVVMRLNSNDMLEINGQEYFTWENNKWGFILLSTLLSNQKIMVTTSLLNSDGVLKTGLSSNKVTLENCYISFFAPSLNDFTHFRGVMEDISIYDRLVSQRELKLLLREQEPRLRYYTDFTAINGMVMPNLAHYLLKMKVKNYSIKNSASYFVDDEFSRFNAINGGDVDQKKNSIPNAADWLINQQKKHIQLPQELLKDLSSFIVYINFDFIAKTKDFTLNYTQNSKKVNNLTLYSRVNHKDVRTGLDLRGGIEKSFDTEWNLPMTISVFDRLKRVLSMDHFINFQDDIVTEKNYFVMLKVYKNRVVPDSYNATLVDSENTLTTSHKFSFHEDDQHYIGSIFKDSDGFSSIFEFKLNEFAFFENTLTANGLICSDESNNIRLGLGNSLQIGCKNSDGVNKLLVDCNKENPEENYCEQEECETCNLEGDFCIHPKLGKFAYEDKFQDSWGFSNLVYDKNTKNVVKTLGHIDITNEKSLSMTIDFPINFITTLVINFQVVVGLRTDFADFDVFLDDDLIMTVNCRNQFNCKDNIIDVYETMNIEIAGSRVFTLTVTNKQENVDYFIRNFKYGINKVSDVCGEHITTDSNVKCSTCDGSSGIPFKYLNTDEEYFYGSCFTSCPSGFFTEGNECIKCPDNCPDCTSLTDCNACYNNNNSDTIEFDYGDSISTAKYVHFKANSISLRRNYITSFYNKCSPCLDFCDNCDENPSNCTTCASGYFNSSGVCKKCNDECKECSGPDRNNCTRCASGKYVNTYGNCELCGSNCAECETTYDNCTECNPEVSVKDELGQCIGIEFTNMFYHKVLKLYQKCEDCQNCVEQSQKVCSRCSICNKQCEINLEFIQSKIKILVLNFKTITSFSTDKIDEKLQIIDLQTNKEVPFDIWEIKPPGLFLRITDPEFANDTTREWKIRIQVNPELIKEAKSCYITPIHYIYKININRQWTGVKLFLKVMFLLTFFTGLILAFFNIKFLAFVVTFFHSLFILNLLLPLKANDNSVLYGIVNAMTIDIRLFEIPIVGINVDSGVIEWFRHNAYNTLDFHRKYTVGFTLFHLLALGLIIAWIVLYIKIKHSRNSSIRNINMHIDQMNRPNKIVQIHNIVEIIFINVFIIYLPYQYLDYINVTLKLIPTIGGRGYGFIAILGFILYNIVGVYMIIRYLTSLSKAYEFKEESLYVSALSVYVLESDKKAGLHSGVIFMLILRYIGIIIIQLTFNLSAFISGFIISFINLFYFSLLLNCDRPRLIYLTQYVSEFLLFFMTYMLVFNHLLTDIDWETIIFYFFIIYAIYIMVTAWIYYIIFIIFKVKEFRNRRGGSDKRI